MNIDIEKNDILFKILEEAAINGNANAAAMVGYLLIEDERKDCDYKQAAEHLTLAVQKGSECDFGGLDSSYYLARCRHAGPQGTQNLAAAFRLYMKSDAVGEKLWNVLTEVLEGAHQITEINDHSLDLILKDNTELQITALDPDLEEQGKPSARSNLAMDFISCARQIAASKSPNVAKSLFDDHWKIFKRIPIRGNDENTYCLGLGDGSDLIAVAKGPV